MQVCITVFLFTFVLYTTPQGTLRVALNFNHC